MHAEFYSVTEQAADTINRVKRNGGKVIAVGTTSTRTLETIGSKYGEKCEQNKVGRLFSFIQATILRWLMG